MEHPIKMDDLGVPLFLETPIYIYIQLPFKAESDSVFIAYKVSCAGVGVRFKKKHQSVGGLSLLHCPCYSDQLDNKKSPKHACLQSSPLLRFPP